MPSAAPDLWTFVNRECRCIGVEVEQVQRWIERDLVEHGHAGQTTNFRTPAAGLLPCW
jgi:hypothetical protein